jgi:hypothetical protein
LFGEAWDSVADTVSTIIVIGALLFSVKGKLLWWQLVLLIMFIVLMNIWSYTQESLTTFQKTRNYNMLAFKKDKFKNEHGLIPRTYIFINEGAMGIDTFFDMTGGFPKWKYFLTSIMPYIGCGNLMILFAILILSFTIKK